ncbi:RNA polymerase sigma factor [Aliikangiella sp. IMCC44653]
MSTTKIEANQRQLQWLYAITQGNRSAFEQLYLNCGGQLLAVAINLLGRKDLAEEVIQETFVKIWHNADNYHANRGSVMTWLVSMVRNRCIDELRHNKVNQKHQARLPLPTDINPNMESQSTLSDNVKLKHCVEQLDSGQRQSIQLAYFYGLTQQEITKHIEAPLGTIKSWIKRGLQSLKSCLSA